MSHPAAKDEALRAIAHILERLGAKEPIDEMACRQLAAAATYAREQVEAIQELMRPRRHKPVKARPFAAERPPAGRDRGR